MFNIIIPNRFPDVIQPLLQSIEEKEDAAHSLIIVADGHENFYGHWGVKYSDPHFCYSKAINLGIKQTGLYEDVVLLNDDCKVLEWNFFNRLRDFAYARPEVGILSPLIVGCVGGEGQQRFWEKEKWWGLDVDFIDILDPHPVCFPCVFIKKKMLSEIGLMKESIAGYGGDDVELCQRARAAGWKTSVTQRLTIQHADGSPALGDGRGKSWAKSYMKRWPKSGKPTDAEIDGYLRRNNLNTES